jgi:hypothetical protein
VPGTEAREVVDAGAAQTHPASTATMADKSSPAEAAGKRNVRSTTDTPAAMAGEAGDATAQRFESAADVATPSADAPKDVRETEAEAKMVGGWGLVRRPRGTGARAAPARRPRAGGGGGRPS